MVNIDLYRNPFTTNAYKEITDRERYDICQALDSEYRGDGMTLDSVNIEGRVMDSINRARLDKMSVFINIYRRIIDTENCSYAQKGFHRQFINATKAEQQRIEEIYKELNSSLEFLQFEHQAGYMGTVAVTITTDPNTDKLRFIKLTPNIQSFNVIPNPYYPNEPSSIAYSIKLNKETKIKYTWDISTFKEEIIKGESTTISNQYMHNYQKTPFAILRYIHDSNTFWGPVDYGAYKFCQVRSLLLADSVLRTQTSLFDILLFTGFTAQEAIQSVKRIVSGKVIVAPEAKRVEGGDTIQEPDVKFINPSMLEPGKVWELYENIFNHFLRSRGLSPKNFEVSSDPSSAEALRLSDNYLMQQHAIKREHLKEFEQQMFDIIRWYNNNFTNERKISDKVQLVTDFFDPIIFRSVSERVDYYDFLLRNNLTTPPKIMQQENPDLTTEQAEQQYKENVKANAPEVKDVPINQENVDKAQLEADGVIPEGNPIERGQDKSGTYVRYGKSGKKYYYNDDASYKVAKQKAASQARAILTSGYQE